jgi:hypothetical protein
LKIQAIQKAQNIGVLAQEAKRGATTKMNQIETYDGCDRAMNKARYTNAFLLALSYEIKLEKKICNYSGPA